MDAPDLRTFSEADEKQKTVTILWVIKLTPIRGLYAAFAIAAFYVLSTWVAPLVGMESSLWILLTPVAFFAVFWAVYAPGGHYLEWWIPRKWNNLTQQSLLLPSHCDEQASANPIKRVRQSVQDALPVENIEWQWIKTEEGLRIVVFRIEPYAISLASEEEIRKLWNGAREYYRRIDFPVIEYEDKKRGSNERYERRIRQQAGAELEATTDAASREKLFEFANAHLIFASDLAAKYQLRDLCTYLLIPYDPAVEQAGRASSYDPRGLLSAFSAKPTAYETVREQSTDEEAFSVISTRAGMVYELLSAIGCKPHALTENELEAFFSSASTDVDPDPDEPPRAVEPIMLDAGGYEKLTGEQIAKNVRKAEQVRGDSPPAVGTARLGVKDTITADAIVREPDYVRVGGRFRMTRYVDKWPEDAHFGMLSAVEALDGRIATLKYIWPRPDEEAEDLYSTRVAELDASLKDDTSGDVRSRTHKENSQYAAHLALAEITNKRQSYARLSVFFHMQADTLEELVELDHRLERALRGRSIQSRVAREEGWEGFLTCLPLGRDRLTASTDRSMLSNALACLFSYTTPYLQHEDGILMGLEAGGTPVIYNDWLFSGPGSVTLGPMNCGKTFWAKADSTRKRAIGRRVVILDPAANSYYGRVARRIGGEYAFLRPHSTHKINPFDIGENYMDLALLADALEGSEESYEDAMHKARQSALDSKVQSLAKVLSLMAGSISRQQMGFAMAVLYECYRRAEITNDPATHTQPPPTFSGGGEADFFTVIHEMREKNPSACDELLEKLRIWENGPYTDQPGHLSDLFDSQTTVDFSNKYLVLQVASLDEDAKPPVMAAVMESISGILSNPDELAEFYCDEAHNMLLSPDSAKYWNDWNRTSRVRATSVHSISQDTKEFTDTDWGQTILNQVGCAWIFHQNNPKAASGIADIWGLSERELDDIQLLGQGECYLISGKSRYKVKVEASAEEEVLFDTSPGSETRYRARHCDAHDEAEYTDQAHTGEANSYEPAATHDETDADGPAPLSDPQEQPEEQPTKTGGLREDFSALPALPGEGGDEPCRIYAFSGEDSAKSAAFVARLLAEAAADKDLYVLAVDATTPGHQLTKELGCGITYSPDKYLALGEADVDELGSYISGVSLDYPALMALGSPQMDSLPADPIRRAGTEIFDIIVVACGATASGYSTDWLLNADRVIGCSKDRARTALDAALSAEEVRGTNGTLLATNAKAADEGELNGEAGNRTLFAALSADTNARLKLTTKLISEPDAEKEGHAHD